jgi:prepilin-type N-terminal cleavage/methylation domain-containing protein
MNPRISHQKTAAMTLTEVLTVIAVLLVLAVIAYLSFAKNEARLINCYNNLRAGESAFWIWAGDNNEKFVMELSTNQGGAREPLMLGKVSEAFLVMSNEFCTPKVLFCPTDSRIWATNWGQFDNQHLSYFIGIDATYNTNLTDASMTKFLFGDRNLTSEVGADKGILQLSADKTAGWTTELHNKRGNICLANGEVLKLNDSNLRVALQATGLATNRLAIP